ncbi:hypothetical protein BJX99DRAFT_253204 [Aspergillus californicus]
MLPRLRLAKAQYTLLGHNGSETTLSERLTGLLSIWREFIILVLGVLCTALVLDRNSTLQDADSVEKIQEYSLTSNDHRWIQFQWTTGIYGSQDHSDAEKVNKAWEKIVPAYGFVAVDHAWAAEHHLPASMSLPSNSSKGVYIVDAYHQIHCLTIIRKTLREIQSGLSPTVPLQHSWHCFDSLLQYIVCGNSGDTLLYTWGRNQTGDGQLRKCLDWKSRRNWIRENTACYKDGDHPIPLYDHFTRCEEGEMDVGDGIRLQMF